MPAKATAPQPSLRSPRAAVHAPATPAMPSRTNGTTGERSSTGGRASQRPRPASAIAPHPAHRAVDSERTAC
jgi:hypothetical protein